MTDARTLSDSILFDGLDPDAVVRVTQNALRGADGGELYMSHSRGHVLSWNDGRLEQNLPQISEGYSMRYLRDDAVGFAVGNTFNLASVKAVGEGARSLRVLRQASGKSGIAGPAENTHGFYAAQNPIDDANIPGYIDLLAETDARIRAMDNRIVQASMSFSTTWQVVSIIRQDGRRMDDVRPMTVVRVAVNGVDGTRRESGVAGYGARGTLESFLATKSLDTLVLRAVSQMQRAFTAQACPSGQMPVILGPGAAAVMLHEAVGHGLEGDFNRIGSSTFSGKIGERVAAKGVTVIDQGNLPSLYVDAVRVIGHRGSLLFDDEGTPTGKTVLIEDGILRGYMQDTMNARLMKTNPTGNGRRQGYANMPMPRMTTTFIAAGRYDPQEILESVKGKALYVDQLGGGQVDIVSGKFVFDATEATLVEDGKLTVPVKGACLIGDGPKAMRKVSMVGNDLIIDDGTWTCGKGGQGAAVGVGQPTLKMSGITIGGTAP